MEIVVEKLEFQRAVSKVQGVAEKKSTYPILSHLLIHAGQDRAFIKATDLQVEIQEYFEAQVSETGRICIPAKKLYDIIREFPIQDVYIKQRENFWTEITCDRISISLPGLDPKDFPTFPEGGKECFLSNANLLKDMSEKVIFATSPQESSLNLHGILFEVFFKGDDPFLRMVATDGHRLAIVEEKIARAREEEQFIVPRRGLSELRRLFNGEETIEVKTAENSLKFMSPNGILSVRLLEGQFPDYKHVLPRELEKKALVNRKELLSALRRAEILASERGEGVKFYLSKNTMELNAGGGDIGNFSEKLDIRYDGDDIKIVFNGKYLIDALNVIDTELIRFELRDPESAGLIKPEADESYIYLVMPMKIS